MRNPPTAVPSDTTPTDAGPTDTALTETTEEGWRAAPARGGMWFGLCVGLSLMAHVGFLGAAALGVLPAWLTESAELPGDPDGAGGVNIEIVEGPKAETPFVSFKSGLDLSDNETRTAPAQEAQQQQQPQEQQQPQQQAALAAHPSQQAAPEAKPPDDTDPQAPGEAPPAPQATKPAEESAPRKLTEEQIKRIAAAMASDFQQSISVSIASEARNGQASPFVRSILHILKDAMPRSNRLKANVQIELVVSRSGTIESLRIAESSGNADLDRLVLDSVRATHLVPPARDEPDRNRYFLVTYVYH